MSGMQVASFSSGIGGIDLGLQRTCHAKRLRRRAEQRRNPTPPVTPYYPQGQAVQGDWVDQAQCGGADMYPTTRSRGAGLATTEEAYMLQICKPCPVKAQCLEAGWGDPYGIWGGTTPAQRRSLLRKRSRRAAS